MSVIAWVSKLKYHTMGCLSHRQVFLLVKRLRSLNQGERSLFSLQTATFFCYVLTWPGDPNLMTIIPRQKGTFTISGNDANWHGYDLGTNKVQYI